MATIYVAELSWRMASVSWKKTKGGFCPKHGETCTSSTSCTNLEVDVWRRMQQITLDTLLPQNTTNYSVVFFFWDRVLETQPAAPPLWYCSPARSRSLSLCLFLHPDADRDIGCILTQDSTLSSSRSAQLTPHVSEAKSCDQTATKLQSGVAPLLLNPLTWCPL